MAEKDTITTKFKADISDLKSGITEANRTLKENQSAIKAVASEMDLYGKSADGVKKQMDLMKSSLDAQKSKLDAYAKQLETASKYEKEAGQNVEALKKKLADLASQGFSESSEEVKKYQKELTAAEKEHSSLKSQVSTLTTAMNNQQSTVNKTQKEYDALDKELTDVEKAEKKAAVSGKSVEDELKAMGKEADNTDSKLGKLAKSIASTLAKAAVAGVAAAGAGLVALTKQAVDAYSSYEQLTGGVETLFGTSADTVMKYANNAFKSAGLSANDYMETVTSFSASLLQGLGGDTEKAAKYADTAITDMSDNANKMGTSIESIQNAYQGFAKGNYTMLDNLKLGYGGTKEEMLRLVNESGVLNESVSSLDDVSFDQIIEAIHAVQERMGITGTTAKEASTTIEGSFNSMKGAWQNLLVGFADGSQNLDTLLSNFIDSVGTYASNLLPRIQEVLGTVLSLVGEHLPEITAKVTEWMGMLVDTLISSLPEEFQGLANAIKDGVGTAFEIVKEAFGWIIDNGDQVIAMLAGIAAGFVAFKVATMIQAATKALEGMTLAQAALNAVMAINPMAMVAIAIGALVAAIVLLIMNWDKVKEAAVAAWDKISEIWGKVADWFSTNVIEPVKEFFSEIGTAISGFFSDAWDKIVEVWTAVSDWFNTNVIEPIKEFFQPLVDWFTELFTSIWNTIESVFTVIGQLAEGCVILIKAVWGVVSDWFNTNVVEPVKKFFTALWDTISKAASTAWDAIVKVWTKVKDWFNTNVIEPVKKVFTPLWNSLKDGASKAWDGIKSVFSKVADFFKDTFEKAWTKVKNVFSTGGKIFDGIKDGIVSAFKTVVNAIIKGINKVVATPFNAINKVLDKIRSVSIAGIEPFSGLGSISVPEIPLLAKGGVLKKGQMGLLEGNGAEAVVPLDRNKAWVKAVAQQMQKQLASNNISGVGMQSNVNNFTQIINAPKQPSRIELYRQTKNLLNLKAGV